MLTAARAQRLVVKGVARLEGAVKLGFRKELAAIDDPARRKALFEEMVAKAYDHGKALNTASHFELDDVIDPMESRRWIMSALKSAPPPIPRRPCCANSRRRRR